MFRPEKFLVNSKLLGIETYRAGKPIEEVERELGIKGAIKLASNENPFGPSPKALRAIKAAASKINRYPDAGSFYLKNALSKHLGVDPEQIVLGNGSDEVIALTAKAFIGPGDEMITAKPTFLIYRIATQVQGGKPVEIPMRDNRYDLEAIAKAISPKTKIIFIANPDNPVGTYVNHTELAAFLEKVNERTIVFIDEAYYEFGRIKKDFPTSAFFLKFPNVIISRTFSKAYGLSGLRIGYAFMSRELAEILNKVREPFNINVLAQAAALAALKDEAFVKKIVAATETEKKLMLRALEKRGALVVPSATNFLLVSFGSKSQAICDSVLKRGVIIRSMKGWGMADHFRITLGKSSENKRFLRELDRLI